MSQNSADASDESLPLAHRLLELISCSWMAQAIYVAAELRIADLLADGPKTSEQLAEVAGAHAPSLSRLLQALVTIDICRRREDGTFEMTPLGSLLNTDAPGSLRHWTIWWGGHLWPIWGQLLYSVRTGQSARKLLLGTDGFEHLERDPEAAALFDRAAAEMTRLTAENVVRAYDFSSLRHVMDVGGGCGELLISILRGNPATRGILFERPHAIEHGRRHLEQAGLASRCEFIAGDFFESVPSGGNAYVLKSVIHDWNDEQSRLILKNCRQAIGRDGRLLLIEQMLPAQLTTSPAHQAMVRSDLNMLITLAAQERTEGELRSLLESAGFRVSRVVPAGLTVSVIEAVPEP